MTESDLYVKVQHSSTTRNMWRWKITVYDRKKVSSYSDGIVKQSRTDMPVGKTLANWKAKRMLKKARRYKEATREEWTIE